MSITNGSPVISDTILPASWLVCGGADVITASCTPGTMIPFTSAAVRRAHRAPWVSSTHAQYVRNTSLRVRMVADISSRFSDSGRPWLGPAPASTLARTAFRSSRLFGHTVR